VGTPGGGDFVDRAGSLTGEIDVRFIDILRLRLRSLFLRTRVERELDEELEYHLERQIQEHIAAGFNERTRVAPRVDPSTGSNSGKRSVAICVE
jgi:hypothetical protein